MSLNIPKHTLLDILHVWSTSVKTLFGSLSWNCIKLKFLISLGFSWGGGRRCIYFLSVQFRWKLLGSQVSEVEPNAVGFRSNYYMTFKSSIWISLCCQKWKSLFFIVSKCKIYYMAALLHHQVLVFRKNMFWVELHYPKFSLEEASCQVSVFFSLQPKQHHRQGRHIFLSFRENLSIFFHKGCKLNLLNIKVINHVSI